MSYFVFATWGADPLVTLPLVTAACSSSGSWCTTASAGVLQEHVVADLRNVRADGVSSGFGSSSGPTTSPLGEHLSGVIEIGRVTLPVPQLTAVVSASLATVILYWLVFRLRWAHLAAGNVGSRIDRRYQCDRMYALAWGIGAACVGVAGSLLSISTSSRGSAPYCAGRV